MVVSLGDESAAGSITDEAADDALDTREGTFLYLERLAGATSAEPLVTFLGRLAGRDAAWLDVDVRVELSRHDVGTTVRVAATLGKGRRELVIPAVRSTLAFDDVRSTLARLAPRLAPLDVIDGADEAIVGLFLTSSKDDSLDVAIDETSLAASAGGMVPTSASRPPLSEPWLVDEAWEEPAAESRPTVPAPAVLIAPTFDDIEERGPDTPRQMVSEKLLESSRMNLPAMPDDDD